MKYKINLHAHTIFSDGINTPMHMAIEAKRLGLSALVITDHYYGGRFSESSLSADRYALLKMSCHDAKEILPVIVGVEFAFMGVELLIFGSGLVKWILRLSEKECSALTVDELLKIKKESGAGIILCHPSDPDTWEKVLPLLDGFEEYNSGHNFFKNRSMECLKGLTRWCNSDAHETKGLGRAFNTLDSKIENEHDLIKYIRSGKQPERYLNLSVI